MNELRSYPKVYNLGHRAIRDLFFGDVVVQEKVDGSQFSFGIVDGQLQCRSRGRMIPDLDDAGKLFAGAIATARDAADRNLLMEGAIYRGEAMMGPRHNVLTYERAPRGNFVLFDVDTDVEDRCDHREVLEAVAEALQCEITPEHYRGPIDDLEAIKALIEKGSFLGGPMEGLVFKNYDRFGVDGKMLMGKYVTDAFREAHKQDPNWKPRTNAGIIEQIGEVFRHERRWEKSIERLRDSGELEGSPRDIGPLIRDIQGDVLAEEYHAIAKMFMDYYAKDIRGAVIKGFPQWYKERLAEAQFDPPMESPTDVPA